MTLFYILITVYVLLSAYLASDDLREEFAKRGVVTTSKLLTSFFLFWAYGFGLIVLTMGLIATNIIRFTARLYRFFKIRPPHPWRIFKLTSSAFIFGTVLLLPFVPLTKSFFLVQFLGWVFITLVFNWIIQKQKFGN